METTWGKSGQYKSGGGGIWYIEREAEASGVIFYPVKKATIALTLTYGNARALSLWTVYRQGTIQ